MSLEMASPVKICNAYEFNNDATLKPGVYLINRKNSCFLQELIVY